MNQDSDKAISKATRKHFAGYGRPGGQEAVIREAEHRRLMLGERWTKCRSCDHPTIWNGMYLMSCGNPDCPSHLPLLGCVEPPDGTAHYRGPKALGKVARKARRARQHASRSTAQKWMDQSKAAIIDENGQPTEKWRDRDNQ